MQYQCWHVKGNQLHLIETSWILTKDQKAHQTTAVMKMLLCLTGRNAFCVKKNTKEALQCPADIKRSDIVPGAGYHTLTANLLRFQQLNILPAEIDLSLFDEGSGIANTLLKQ